MAKRLLDVVVVSDVSNGAEDRIILYADQNENLYGRLREVEGVISIEPVGPGRCTHRIIYDRRYDLSELIVEIKAACHAKPEEGEGAMTINLEEIRAHRPARLEDVLHLAYEVERLRNLV